MRRSFTFPIFRSSRSSVYEPTPYSTIPISIAVPRFPLPGSHVNHFPAASAMTCIDTWASLHPGLCAIACIGVPGPTTPPPKNSPPYRLPMSTFYRLAFNSSSVWSIILFQNTHVYLAHSVMPTACHTMSTLVHHADHTPLGNW
jgi:hypothetical protein